MKKRKIRKRIILIVILFIFLIVCFLVGKKIYIKLNTFNIKVIDKIGDYPYSLDDRDTELFKANYNDLKNLLNESEINYEKYAETIAKLYIIDLYTLNNKVNKYDVGSVEFVYPSALENYKLKVQDTIYKYIVDNTNKKRIQELPIVSEIKVGDINEMEYKIGDEKFSAYKVLLIWNYEKDLGYDNKGSVIVVKSDKLLYVAEYTNE